MRAGSPRLLRWRLPQHLASTELRSPHRPSCSRLRAGGVVPTPHRATCVPVIANAIPEDLLTLVIVAAKCNITLAAAKAKPSAQPIS